MFLSNAVSAKMAFRRASPHRARLGSLRLKSHEWRILLPSQVGEFFLSTHSNASLVASSFARTDAD
ncbi:uncharacterized protein B0H18DRAFT_1045182 [Fomitopsis serialis]|uniref:uncharacterized protein n=1 Tax=Fomitopsis serialis TaxID=139415 RepID=UPI002008485D|nr:uncharacterized protein B0H18DRAFT_1045182 [Neoantrodia serialis]KAH9914482.1 hypothetical protein B0H18DRAFT_1045182 [Neoantrodia serialis]